MTILSRVLLVLLVLAALVAAYLLGRGWREVPSETSAPQVSYENASEDWIVVTSPLPGARITSPLRIEGMARGNWFFEANAGVRLTDEAGVQIAQKYVMAQGEWMTTNFVPFFGELTFPSQESGKKGYLYVEADNPSDLSQNDRSIRVPIQF